MGKVTFAAVIYEKFKSKDDTYPIKLRVTYKKTPTYFSTNLVAHKSDLYLSSSSKNIPIKNNLLKKKVQDLICEYEEAAQSFNPYLFPDWGTKDIMEFINKQIKKKQGFRLSFVEFSNSFIEDKKATSKKAADNYRFAINSFCSYIGQTNFDISIITSALMRNYQEWLEKKYGKDARAVSLYTSAIMAIHKAARKKFNSEELDELNIRDISEYYSAPKQPSAKHRDISPEIVQKMINDYQGLTGRERLAVGAFLLGFSLMGMNTPDLYECEAPKKGVLHYYRHKTRGRRDDDAEMYVKIPECILPIYHEYSDKQKKRAFHFYIRYSSYENMEDAEIKGLRSYKDRIRYKGKLTYYSCRHTWSTIARSSKCNIGLDVIDACLDHVSMYKDGDRYARPDYNVYWNANDKVLATLDWEPLKIE